jgi:hypothetical protein
LNIATESLLSGTAGVSYSQSMAVEGGVGPYIWVARGAPPGLMLGGNGTLTGIPASAGEYTAAVTVLDDSTPTQVSEQSFGLGDPVADARSRWLITVAATGSPINGGTRDGGRRLCI